MRRRGKGEKEWPTVGKLFVACFARSRFLKNREERRRVNPGCSSGETRLQILKNRSYSRSLNSRRPPYYRLPLASGHPIHTHTRTIYFSPTLTGGILFNDYSILFYFIFSNLISSFSLSLRIPPFSLFSSACAFASASSSAFFALAVACILSILLSIVSV